MSFPFSIAWAHPLVRDWFVQRFGTPTEPQEQGWPHILAGHTTLISAPTGSGKTLAGFRPAEFRGSSEYRCPGPSGGRYTELRFDRSNLPPKPFAPGDQCRQEMLGASCQSR